MKGGPETSDFWATRGFGKLRGSEPAGAKRENRGGKRKESERRLRRRDVRHEKERRDRFGKTISVMVSECGAGSARESTCRYDNKDTAVEAWVGAARLIRQEVGRIERSESVPAGVEDENAG